MKDRVRQKLLVTGATGFVGNALLKRLVDDGRFTLLAGVRRSNTCNFPSVEPVPMGDIDAGGNWLSALQGVDQILHTAARVHVMHDSSSDPLNEFRRVNVDGTLNLARQAAKAGVRRFIFISSIKVNGEGTLEGGAYCADDNPQPVDFYGISKMEAEQGLRALMDETGMEVVIIRPPMVYGPGVKANFLTMMRWLHKGVPLPFGAIYNRRSLVALDNLIDLLVTCVDHPAAANQTFLVSDGEDLSTTELLRRLSIALGKPSYLLPIPSIILEAGAAILRKRALSQRLCGSLQVDIDKTRDLLSWNPPVGVDQALRNTAKHFLEQQFK
ncbi:N-acetyl-alpha-D-glucosaminyl-diphospho-ditrans, octacis-undecaprenol 4-epimerase [Microbulbifer sp. NBRC 101763]|uniref:UDP-glucose 4-epimerase family protein n=1 Tax=Microbulbifer sp. NBRC 101763 TaxID=1113820 RepID=UPI0030B5B567